MKRTTAMAVLGLVLVGAESAFGLGAIEIGNYQPPYNPVVWGQGFPKAGQPVNSTDGVQLRLWYAKGDFTGQPFQFLPTDWLPLDWNTLAESYGYAGYYNFTTVYLFDWQEGDTYTFQVGDPNLLWAWSQLWTENSDIRDISGAVPPPPGRSHQSIGFTIATPEPTTNFLAVLGAGAFLLLRRKRS